MEDWKEHFPRSYSAELKPCISLLPLNWSKYARSQSGSAMPSVSELREQIMPIAQRKMTGLQNSEQKADYCFSKPTRKKKVKTGRYKNDVYYLNIADPYFYAVIGKQTSTVLRIHDDPDVEKPVASRTGVLETHLRVQAEPEYRININQD
jgi:hypothetical protein